MKRAACFGALALTCLSPASAQLSSQYGILDLAANGGINPNTGVAWQAGDQYRLAFHTDAMIDGTSNDPAVYDNFATAQAQQSTLGNGSITTSTGWTALVWVNTDPSQAQGVGPLSDPTVRAGLNDFNGGAGVGGAGVPVYAMNGTTCIARNNADIDNNWSNPFDGDAVIRLASGTTNLDSNGNSVTASQNVHYSPFLDQFGLGDTANVHGADVMTGGIFDSHVNAAGDTIDNTTFSRGSSNANSTGRVWNRFTDATTTQRSVYAISPLLTVMTPGDTTPPTLAGSDIVDDKGGAAAEVGETVTYTVTFSEAMNASTVEAADFENNPTATATISVDSVSTTGNPAVYEVAVTPTGTGTLNLQVKAGADMKDVAGNALDTTLAIADDTTIQVNDPDSTPPTVAFTGDNVGGGPIVVNGSVTYTLTFSEAMDALTIGTGDFENSPSATSTITVDSVGTTADPAVFKVTVTATATGTVILQIRAGADMKDLAGNALDTSAAIPDTSTIDVNEGPDVSGLKGQLGILNLTANGGINPNTGLVWAAGDQYRLAFHTDATITATSNDPAVYDNFATAQANLSTLGNGSITTSTGWTALVWVNTDPNQAQGDALSNPAVRAGLNDFTGGAGVGGAGVPVYAMDGTTAIARNNADIDNNWSNPFDGDAVIRLASGTTNLDSNGNPVTASQNVHYSPFLNQFGLGDSANVHGADVMTGGIFDSHVNAAGDTIDDTTFSRGSSNANSTGRVWNRFTDATTTQRSVYALSPPLTVMATGGGDPYGDWAGRFTGLTDDDPALDFDLGGLATGIEWVVGGDPTDPGDDAGLAPTNATDGTSLVFTYQRSDEANTDTNTTIKAEYGTDLQNWTDAQDGVAGVIISVTDGSPADTVEVKIPLSLAAPGTALFARLKVTVTVP